MDPDAHPEATGPPAYTIQPQTQDSDSGASSDGQGQNRIQQGKPALHPDEQPEIIHTHEDSKPTDSHELADQAARDKPEEEKGFAEVEHNDLEVKNLGWNTDDPAKVANPLVGGLKNDDLWVLVRRFDQQVFHVKSIPEAPLDGLDLNIADQEEFSPDKLRSHVERLYMTVFVGAYTFWKHIVRLRSWRETRRTSAFLAVYASAWALDLLVPTFLSFLAVLVAYPPSRAYCFPPAPPSLIDSSTGGVRKPVSGVLASADSITGAPEKRPGEAVEQEAHSFVSSISSLFVSAAAGKHPQGDPPSDSDSSAAVAGVPDPADISEDVANAKDRTGGQDSSTKHDKTRKPVSQAIWVQARPVMHMIADFVDTYERFGNALSPTPPFHTHKPRVKLAGILAPLILASLLTTSYAFAKIIGFSIGFGFFGDPLIQRGLDLVNRRIPNWQKYIELRNTILKGIPTNAQLTLTLLRIGERNKAPIPPPPGVHAPPSHEPVDIENTDLGLENLGVDKEEIEEAVRPDEDALALSDEETQPGKPGKGRRLMNLIKGTAKGSINTTLTANKVKAAAGSHHAKDRLGVVKKHRQADPAKGPVRFPARYKGKPGHAYITATATTPALSWTSEIEDLNPAWTVTIGDIEGLRKVGGLGWKSKIVVGWATRREIADGLVITDSTGKERHLTAIVTRDELFNRLVAAGSQMWEAW